MVILIKVNVAMMIPNSALGKIMSCNDLKIEDYFTKMTKVFEKMTEDDRMGPSQTLLSFKRRMQLWLQNMAGVVNRKGDFGNDDLQNRENTADTAANSNIGPKVRSVSQSADTTSTEGGPLANAADISATMGGNMPSPQKPFEAQTEQLNGPGMFGNGDFYNPNNKALAHGHEPGLDPILNVPLALNGFECGSAFPMADFLFGGMESFGGGFMFDGSGAGSVGNGQNSEFQGENMPFDFTDLQACPNFRPQL